MKNEMRRISDQVSTENLRNDLSHFDNLARGFMRDRPLAAIATALGIGYAVGRIVARR
jgi:hypothetical protein